MSGLDPVGASLYFSAASAASKETEKKRDRERLSRAGAKGASFASLLEKSQEIEALVSEGLPAEIAGLSAEEAVVFLKDAVDAAADSLVSRMDADSFSGFRRSVSQFMKYVAMHNYEVSKIKRFGLSRKKGGPFFADTRPRDPYVQIQVVDEKLDRLAAMLLQNHADKLKLLAQVDEIKGLLIDFFAA